MKDSAPHTYRSLNARLVDDPGYQQALSAEAKLVYLTLLICKQRGAAGIFRFYLAVLVEQVSPLTKDQVVQALEELERDEAVKWDQEAGVLWVVNALGEDRSVSLDYEKHRTGILRSLNDIPPSKLKAEFFTYYKIEAETDEEDDA